MDKQRSGLADEIHKQITSNKIRMRSRAHFIIGAIALGSGLVMTIFITVFSIAISLFRIRIHAPFLLLQSGQHGSQAFLAAFPWLPLALGILCAISGFFIMRQYDFSYRHALIGILTGGIAIIGLTSFLVDASGITKWVERNIPLPSFSKIDYENEMWIEGIARQASTSQIVVITPEGRTATAIIDQETIFNPPGSVQPGEWIRILGDREDSTSHADDVFHHPAPRGIELPLENNERE